MREGARAPLDVVEMDVEERDHVAGLDLEQRVEAVAARRLEDRVLREQLQRGVVVGITGPLGDLGQALVRLEHADHVGVEAADHPVGLRPAAVLDVVDEHVEVHRLALRRRGRRGRLVVAAEIATGEQQQGQYEGRCQRQLASLGAPLTL